MKKTLAIIGVGMIPSGTSQGIPAFVESLKMLTEHYNIFIYSFIPVDKQKVPAGVRIRCVPYKGMHQRLKYIYLGLYFILDHLRTRIQVIHAQSPFPAGVLANRMNKILGIPWILSFHAGEAVYMPEVPFGDLLNPVLAKIAKRVARRAQAIVALSSFKADMIRTNLQINQRIRVIPRGIVVPPLKAKQPSSPLRLLHISNYHPVKDHETLLNTVAELVQSVSCKLTVAGDNYSEELLEKVKSKGLQQYVELLGSVAHQKIPALFEDAHILIHTSRFETQPMVVLEAMAHGVAVCGTRVGLIADLSEVCCIGVAPGDSHSLAQEIISLTKQVDQFEKMRKDAHAWVKEHDMTWYINELKSCYEEVMNESPKL